MTTAVAERNTYTLEDVERALAELAVTGNRPAIACKRLSVAGLDIPHPTLINWRDNLHAARYREIEAEVAPRIREVVANECESLAIAYAQAERETLEDFDTAKLDTRDKASAIRNLATAKAINVDKMQLLRDRPTAIVQKQDASELLRQLAIDGTAVELLTETDSGNAQVSD